MMKAKVITLGCKVNQYESEAMLSSLLQHVFRKLLRLQGAEAHTLNTRRSAGRFNGVTQMQTELLSVCRKVDARQHLSLIHI